MADPAAFKLQGIKGTRRALRRLPDAVGTATVRNALMAGAKPIADDMRRRAGSAPIRLTGDLAKSIGRRFKYDKGVATVQIAPTGPESSLAHVVEFPTAAHEVLQPRMRRILRHPGTTAQPFMRPAIDSKGDEAVAKYSASVKTQIEKFAAKLSKGGGR